MAPLPSLFVSHGPPTLPLMDVPARRFLSALGQTFERPRAILVVSAHWETDQPTVTSVAMNDTIHDFYGFPPALYAMRYPAPGAGALAERVAALTGAAIEPERGLDHGAWVPLLLMYPEHDIPVAQLSLQPHRGPAHHLAIGSKLAPLRQEGVLVIGSGGLTHNLGELRRGDNGPEPAWVSDFADWFDAALAAGRTNELIDYRHQAPAAARNHPSDEHLLPLYVPLGMGGRARRLHTSALHRALRMDTYAFEG